MSSIINTPQQTCVIHPRQFLIYNHFNSHLYNIGEMYNHGYRKLYEVFDSSYPDTLDTYIPLQAFDCVYNYGEIPSHISSRWQFLSRDSNGINDGLFLHHALANAELEVNARFLAAHQQNPYPFPMMRFYIAHVHTVKSVLYILAHQQVSVDSVLYGFNYLIHIPFKDEYFSIDSLHTLETEVLMECQKWNSQMYAEFISHGEPYYQSFILTHGMGL